MSLTGTAAAMRPKAAPGSRGVLSAISLLEAGKSGCRQRRCSLGLLGAVAFPHDSNGVSVTSQRGSGSRMRLASVRAQTYTAFGWAELGQNGSHFGSNAVYLAKPAQA